jgi:cation:H+ antiporter
VFLPFDIIRMIVGVLVLFVGAEFLIRGSTGIAKWLGVKPLVMGLTVIAYGTSAPELAVSTQATLAHSQPIALGTVIGSCAANISLILGLTALISPPLIDRRIIRREMPFLVGSVVAVPICLRNGEIGRTEGIILIACAVLFTAITLTVSARDATVDEQHIKLRKRAIVLSLPLMAVGLVLLVTGSSLFVGGARHFAAQFGMSERMLGLTVIAIGTAMPELVASVVAAARGQSSFAVGAIIGSNLMNVFLVLGVCAYINPIKIGERMHAIDLIGLVLITLVGVVTLRGPRQMKRWEGVMLLACYAGFVTASALL